MPFDRCVIPSTLDFAQITNRLESAIYDPSFSAPRDAGSVKKQQRYFGQIRGFKFWATRIIGYKYFHVPAFLLPTIEGRLESLYYGHEILLTVKLHSITVTLLLTCLGGLFTVCSSVVDSIVAGTRNDLYLTSVAIATLIYLLSIVYFYVSAWQTTKFFRKLFAQGFAETSALVMVKRSGWDDDLQLESMGARGSSPDWLRKNLPSLVPAQTEKTR
jgi:hypothetical protein